MLIDARQFRGRQAVGLDIATEGDANFLEVG
jgi:hypothetical protein